MALAEQGEAETGVEYVREGLAGWRKALNAFHPYHLGLLAEALSRARRADEGLGLVNEALTEVERSSEHFYEAELYRLKGELLLMREAQDESEAENCFLQAIAVARYQSAKSWELRAVMSLSRLYCQQGKKEDARQMLVEIYGWFTEGFDTVDLREAKALLRTVS